MCVYTVYVSVPKLLQYTTTGKYIYIFSLTKYHQNFFFYSRHFDRSHCIHWSSHLPLIFQNRNHGNAIEIWKRNGSFCICVRKKKWKASANMCIRSVYSSRTVKNRKTSQDEATTEKKEVKSKRNDFSIGTHLIFIIWAEQVGEKEE